MRKLTIGLALVAAMTVAAQTASAINPRCCSYDGTCSIGITQDCEYNTCPSGDVCVDDGGGGCSPFSVYCRLRSTGECIFAVNNCAAAIGCRVDPTCLPETAPAVEAEIEVTWCDADDPVVDEETPCEE